MINYTHKSTVKREIMRRVTNVKCDVCGKDCVVEPTNDTEPGIKYLGVVHAFRVNHGLWYDQDLDDSVYISEDDCCSTKCVLDLLDREYHGGKTLLEVNKQIEISNRTYYIVEEDETMNDKNMQAEVANLIWDICKISPEHGNAVMDIIGEEAYEQIMKEANNDN